MNYIPSNKTTFLRWAVFCCFVAHGIVAIQSSGVYFSEWSHWVQGIFPENEKYIGSSFFLKTVGTIDIVVGISFLNPRIYLPTFWWAIGWGALTAFSRIYFLGSFSGFFVFNVVHPIAEFLVRMPNFIIPTVLLLFHTRGVYDVIISRVSERRLVFVAVLAQAMAIFMAYIVDLNQPMLSYELIKKGMPLFFLHGVGALSVAALVALVAVIGTKSVTNLRLRSGILLTSKFFFCGSYLLVEGFNVIIVNAPHGFAFTAVRIMEHVPVYLCVALFLNVKFGNESV